MPKEPEHEVVDVERWIRQFPIERYEGSTGPRQFPSTRPGDPLDLWKDRGTWVTSPSHLARIEQVRRRVAREHDLGTAVPTDLILWGGGEPTKPYLTKLGGVPYRPADIPWPVEEDEAPMTFVAQFCFADSGDILPVAPTGDVMLLFFRDEESFYDPADEGAVRIEWYDLGIPKPVSRRKCPEPSFPVPVLHGALCRVNEYPESYELFKRAGHDQPYLFSTTQASRLGGDTFFIQGDPRKRGEGLLCTLNSIIPTEEEYPFINRERPLTPRERERLRFVFGDVGCLYFLIDKKGRVRWTMDCY
jgi:Domain of unknown function (DUF1963)